MSWNFYDLNEQTFPIVEELGGHMPGGFFVYQAAEPERLLYANKAVLDIFGCESLEAFQALTGFTFRGMVHPSDYGQVSETIARQIVASEDRMDYVEYRVIRKDGAVRWVEDYGHYALTARYGGIYMVFLSDITEIRAKRENDTAVKDAVIDTLTDAYHTVWLIDDVKTENCSLYHTDQDAAHDEAIAHALSHARYTDMADDYVDNMVAQEDQARLHHEMGLPHILEMFRTCDNFSVTFLRALKTGPRYYRIDFGKVAMPGNHIGVMMGFRDVDSEVRKEQTIQQGLREAMEAANAASRAKSDFLSSMSHDMRTPMNGIIGMTAIASMHLDDRERVSDCLQKITDASGHLLSLINEVLDMNKIESGKVELQEDEVDLSELVDTVLTMIRPQVEARRHRLSVQVSAIAHEKVLGDSTRLRQVLVNLLSNAVKYTPDGGTISLFLSEQPSGLPNVGLYTFEVRDNGIGMKPEFVERIFEPFSRSEDKATQAQQGTGLGMAITRNIVRMMGGDVSVDSTLGEGSTFRVTVYLHLPEMVADEHAQFQGLQILVADDDPLSCEYASCLLNDLGMKSEGVSSGREALSRVTQRHEANQDYFAVLLDWRMPDMNGLETARKIRAVVGPEMPIIVISAHDWTEIEEEAREAGVTAFISKPFFRTKFVHVFHDLLSHHDTHADRRSPLKKLEELSFEGRTVLLAEDNPINAEITINILQMMGLTIDRAENGEEAVKTFSESSPGTYDLVFMDIQMPVMNGYEATKAIRALRREDAAEVPIIAMTANAFEDDRQNALRAGMNGHIAKPLNFDELSSVLVRYLG